MSSVLDPPCPALPFKNIDLVMKKMAAEFSGFYVMFIAPSLCEVFGSVAGAMFDLSKF